MWIFSVLGFYSVACASKPDGSLDADTLMVRARKIEHLRNLKRRFPSLGGAEIITMPHRDYRYRLVVPKSVWVSVLAELASEQKWSNFKNQAAKNQAECGADYARALHDVWEIMNRLQSSGGADALENRR